VKIIIILALLLGLGVPVCGSAESPTRIQEGDPSVKIPLRDPFQPPQMKPKKMVDESRPELERYELSELRLTGVATAADGSLSASIENSSGRGFMVKKGSIVGVNRGKIVEISMDKLVIEETLVNKLGQTTTTHFEMLLRGSTQRDHKPSFKKTE
jgi:Tfp pilus assembly protein PilP